MDHHPIWWTQQPSAVIGETMEMPEKEEMFEKTLTPSDVGKLNRLVIPKQHAERYFPIGHEFENSLHFEDESGKCWKFRYSYWSSSQSYVLTKGWRRYVKEKALDTGDVVVFQQLRVNNYQRFIDFRRKMTVPTAQPPVVPMGPRVCYLEQGGVYPAPNTQFPDQRYCFNPGIVMPAQTTPSNGKSKTFRLFGVDVEYQPDLSENVVSEFTSNDHVLYAHNYMEYNMSGGAKPNEILSPRMNI